MTKERWQLVERIYHAALERDGGARDAFLAQECAGDNDLHREVEKLIGQDDLAGSFIESPAIDVAARILAEDSVCEMEGRLLGSYKVLSRLGTGGMGVVYLGEDTSLGRRVAIKFLSPELTDDEHARKRLIREAHAAASLDHPNICAIYEIREQEGESFIVMQYVEGETLAERMKNKPLELRESLDIGIQIADALAEAHSQGIIHRDIKPQNIMITPRGQAKLMDFGIARVIRKDSLIATTETESALSEQGVAIGTAPYMSPEQVRAEELDARSDIFSFGVMFYEMLTGTQPFKAACRAETMAAILTKDPPPLERRGSEIPDELQRIVRKAISKDKERRYQTIKDLLIDLRELRQETAPGPKLKGSTTVIDRIRRHRLSIASSLAALIVAAYFFSPSKPALTDKDTILLADFVNTTGDPAFDGGTLKQGLAIHLQQSPFLNLFPDAGVRQVLRLMNKSPDERVTREVGREIALRQGLKAVIAGSIAKFERNYSLTLEAINSQTGERIALKQVETEDQVLKALSQAATELREELGEPLSLIQEFDKPLEDATTANLEALRAWSAGAELRYSGRMGEAIPFLKRAVEIDPGFATAYGDLSVSYIFTNQRLAAEYAEKAYALRHRAGEFEQLRITASYHGFVTGDYVKRTESSLFQKRMYPRDWTALAQLCASYNGLGQFEEALVEARESVRLNPTAAPAYRNLAWALLGLNRFDEAKDAATQALERHLEMSAFHTFLYQIAFIGNDTAAMQQQIYWARGNPNEYVALGWEADAAAYAGQWRRAQETARRAVDLTARGDMKEVAARYECDEALRACVFGQFKSARVAAANSLALERDQRWSHAHPALALALSGDVSQAQKLLDELVKRYPNATRINDLWAPVIRAAMELQRGNGLQAIELLKAALRYEAAAAFWPQYLRGQAYLKLNKGSEAAAEFQKILDHHGQAPLSSLYPLAHLGLARAARTHGRYC